MNDATPSRRKNLSGPTYYDMLLGALDLLRSNREEVNRLNVYPVPDGDTGTNMLLTLESAIGRIDDPAAPLGQLAAQASVGSLMGARGNSGVILSQFFRGMAAVLEEDATASPKTLARACSSGVRAAYSAVMRPVEGTILTVAREAAKAAEEAAEVGGNVGEVLESALIKARRTLAQTPEMLDVLREAGVVDAGGQGLVYIIEGALVALGGGIVRMQRESASDIGKTVPMGEDVVLEFPFDAVFLIRTGEPRATATATWESWGDSLVIVGDEDLVKVHIHTDRPTEVLSLAMELGELVESEIHNMQAQVAERRRGGSEATTGLELPGEFRGDTGGICLIPIAIGEGIIRTFESLGAATVVRGGATMNPSTEDILRAIETCPGEPVVLLPNNSNLILACEQARDISDRNVEVVRTVTVAEGLAAALAATSNRGSADEVIATMRRAADAVVSVEITYAVEDRRFAGMDLSRGDVIGFVDGELKAVGSSPTAVLVETLRPLFADSDRRVSVFVGSEVNAEELGQLRRTLATDLPRAQVDLLPGEQAHYYFVAAVD